MVSTLAPQHGLVKPCRGCAGSCYERGGKRTKPIEKSLTAKLDQAASALERRYEDLDAILVLEAFIREDGCEVGPGDRLVLETPGGGG